MATIETDGLSKEFRVFERREGIRGAFLDLAHRRYRTLRAVDSVRFSIRTGERVGYIGPNGAGKSTTLKMLTGILVPTSGTVAIDGLDPHRDRKRCLPRIGAVFGQRSQLWWDLAPIESFRLLARIYGVTDEDLKRRLDLFDDLIELGPLLRTPVRKLSLGQKMRCELAAAVLHSPDVLFLDEPTIGLDLVAKEGIRRFLLEENRARGTTLLLTTHDLTDVEELCDRVMIIDHGRVLYDGTLDALKKQIGGGDSLIFQLADSTPSKEPGTTGTAATPRLTQLEEATRGLPVKWTEDASGADRATFTPEDVSRAEVIRRVLDRFSVLDITFADVRVEDVIRRFYKNLEGGRKGES